MATTETKTEKTGFRLPWSADNRTDDPPLPTAPVSPKEAVEPAPQTAPAEADTSVPAAEVASESPLPAEPDAPPATGSTPAPEAPQDQMLETTATTSPRRPTKFLADLTNAMRTAAEAERADIVSRFEADAKAFTELIHERSGMESADLRKHADDDIAGIREWSKAEIARIREETEQRISTRRADLDEELESHAARIEREVERVKSIVDSYAVEMAGFFGELAGEDDPTRFAALAANLPEPPSLDDALAALAKTPPPAPPASALPAPTPTEVPVADIAADIDPPSSLTVDPSPEPPAAATAEMDRIMPTADASDDATLGEPEETDPRVSALGLTPDFAAAEAEAMAIDDGATVEDGEAIPAIDEDALAARLAGLTTAPDATPEATTQLVVTGLVSVASIAGFKRHLGRVAGVRTVGVSSGPDGEFLFNVTHDQAMDLRDAIPTLPGFAARVTGTGDGILNVAAQDPESNS